MQHSSILVTLGDLVYHFGHGTAKILCCHMTKHKQHNMRVHRTSKYRGKKRSTRRSRRRSARRRQYRSADPDMIAKVIDYLSSNDITDYSTFRANGLNIPGMNPDLFYKISDAWPMSETNVPAFMQEDNFPNVHSVQVTMLPWSVLTFVNSLGDLP